MNNFLIGVLSSVSASVIIYLARFKIGLILNLIFHRYFPNVSGKYLWIFDRKKEVRSGSDAYPNQKIYLHLKQIVSSVKGHCEVFSGDELKRNYSVSGSISPTRVLRISFECKTENHHDFGVGLFKLDPDGKNLSGKTTVLCVTCEDTTSTAVDLKKLQ